MRIPARLVICVVVIVTAVSAQTKPNFSGKWTAIPDAKAPPPPANPQLAMLTTGGWGNDFTLAQDKKTRTGPGSVRAAETTSKYALDGTETKSEQQGMVGGPTAIVSKAHWQGAKLVVEENSATNMMGNNITMGVK